MCITELARVSMDGQRNVFVVCMILALKAKIVHVTKPEFTAGSAMLLQDRYFNKHD